MTSLLKCCFNTFNGINSLETLLISCHIFVLSVLQCLELLCPNCLQNNYFSSIVNSK